MKILVFGAGGVGSVMGAFLARSGHSVSLVGRRAHLDAIDKKGLHVSGIWGEYRMKAFDLYESVKQIPSAASFDLLLLTVKSHDTRAAVAELAPLVGSQTTVLSFQNGLGNIETILERIPADQYLVGRVIFGVEFEPGEVKVTVEADPLAIGAAPGSAHPLWPPARAAATFTNAKLPAVAVPDIVSVIWAKAIYNCALNPICSLGEMTYGRILENDATRARMREVVKECYAVGKACGVRLEPPTAEEYTALLETKLIPSTAAHFPSMLQDLKKGKRTDVEALNGAVAALGKKNSVSTPVNDTLVKEILNLSNK